MIHDTLSTTVIAAIHMAAKFDGAAVKQVGYDPMLIRP
jgi:hypothetical protein